MNKAHPIQVEAFAPVEWDGSVSLGYKRDETTNEGNWGLEGEIKVTRNEESWSLGASEEKQGGNLSSQLFENMQTFLNKIFSKICNIKSDYGDIKITPPLLEISGGVSNKELDGKYNVDTKGEIKIGMNPLLGITAEAKILNWLIAIASGPFKDFLLMVKDRIAQGHHGKNFEAQADVDIIFSAGMEIEGDVSWHKEKQQPWKPKGKISDEIPLKMEGYAEGKIRVFRLIAAAGIKAGAESAVGIDFKAGADEEQPNANMQLYFNGLTVYYTTYRECDIVGKDSTNKKSSFIPSSNIEKQVNFNKTYKGQYEVFKPSYWPEKPKVIKLTEGTL
jgi:hypothetical protein